MVCIAEKGAVTVRLTVDIVGGHASAPPSETAIGILAKAVQKVESSPMPAHADPALDIFDTLKTGFSLPLRIIMTNLWLFSPLLKFILTLKPLTAVLVRTTTALTIFSAGTKQNVLPSKAVAFVNHRIHPNDSVAKVLAWDTSVINDSRVQVESVDDIEPAPVSDANHPAFKDITTSIHRTYKGSCSVAPSLFVANSDSKHYWNVSPQIFRFNPITLHESELNMFHGVNERIRVDDYAQLVYFYRNLIELTDKRFVPLESDANSTTSISAANGSGKSSKKHD
jgi:carboxypeptidase PM20D1